MTGVENLLRSAAREKATEITPESIPPLDVAGLSAGRGRRRRHRPPRFARWPRLAIPLAAAVAVVAVIALSIAVPRILTGRGGAGGPIASASPPATGPSGSTPTDAIPPYYIALTSASSQPDYHPVSITIRSTMTGAALATVKPPAPRSTFTLVAHGTSDDTFLVGVQPWRSPANSFLPSPLPVTLMLLHFDPSTRSVSFSSLPIPNLTGPGAQSVALSPDGAQLAVAFQPSPTVSDSLLPHSPFLDLDVYSLTGGGLRTWSLRGAAAAQWSIENPDSAEGGGGTNPNAMSWLPDGRTLVFNLSQLHGLKTVAETVRELDVDGPGGALLADSRTVFALNLSTAPFECLDALQLSADSATVTCAGYESQSYSAASAKAGPAAAVAPSSATRSVAQVSYGFGVFSVATGRLSAVLAPTPLDDPLQVDPRLFWQSGGTLIGTLSGTIIIVSGGNEHVTPWQLPTGQSQGSAIDVAW